MYQLLINAVRAMTLTLDPRCTLAGTATASIRRVYSIDVLLINAIRAIYLSLDPACTLARTASASIRQEEYSLLMSLLHCVTLSIDALQF